MVKNPPAMQETWVWSLCWEDPWRRAWQPTPWFLPGKSPWAEEPGGRQSMGSQRGRHDWSDLAQHIVSNTKICNASRFMLKICVFWFFTFLFFLQHKNRLFSSKFLALTLLLLFCHPHFAGWEAQSSSVENAFLPARLYPDKVVVCFPPDIYMAHFLQGLTQKSPRCSICSTTAWELDLISTPTVAIFFFILLSII